METAYLNPVLQILFRLETLMRISGLGLFQQTTETHLSCRFTATHMDLEVRWSSSKHNLHVGPGQPLFRCCDLSVGGRSGGFLILDIMPIPHTEP